MPTLQRITFPLLVLAVSACSGFEPPRARTLARLRPMRIAASVPGQFELELASPGLTGIFDVVFAVSGRAFELQLFPDIGGKVFDLAVAEGTVTAEMPGSRYTASAPLDRAEPHLALVLASVFAELLAPVGADRVLGERSLAHGACEVALQPALGSGTVVATVAADGHVIAYAIRLGRLAFEFTGAGELRGRGVEARFRFGGNG